MAEVVAGPQCPLTVGLVGQLARSPIGSLTTMRRHFNRSADRQVLGNIKAAPSYDGHLAPSQIGNEQAIFLFGKDVNGSSKPCMPGGFHCQ